MNIIDNGWHKVRLNRFTSKNQIHVWRAFLDLSAFQVETMLKTLSADEVERAERFRFEKDKKRFIAAHGILRNILGNYIGLAASEIKFEYSSNRKPVLARQQSTTIFFNLSHSGAFALYAITCHRNIGIDIELIRNDIAVEQIAGKFFSENELAALERINKNDVPELFFQYWTRKEAILKASGQGVAFPMEKLDVSLIHGTTFSPIMVPGNEGVGNHWYVRDLFPYSNCKAAVAIDQADYDLMYADYSF